MALPSWLARLFFAVSALAFALFVRVTLYSKPDSPDPGARGLVVPIVLLVGMVVWYLVAAQLVKMVGGRRRGDASTCIGATFLPMLVTLPISASVLSSVSFAREYWIDRSLKVEMMLGLPLLVILLQMGVVFWSCRQLTWRRALPVMGVLGLGLVLRLAGMGWGLPFAYQPEETSIYVRWAIEFALHGQINPHYFQNPSLLIYLLGLEFLGVFAFGRVLQFGQDAGDLYMVFRGEQDLFYGLSRFNSVILGVATVLVVYLIARRWWGERGALLASLLLAVNFLHVRNSQYAVNDVPSTFFLVLSFYFACRVADGGRLRDYLLAGLMAGLAASTKYNAGMVVVSVAAAYWVHHPNLAARLKPAALIGPIGSAIAALFGFVLGTPFSVLSFEEFQSGFLEQLAMGSAPWSGQSQAPTAWIFITGIVQGAGLVATILALVGVVLLWRRDRRQGAMLFSFFICYLGFMGSMELFFVRWVVPAMPFVALAAGYGLIRILDLPSFSRNRYLAIGLVLLALLQPAVYSLKLDWLLQQKDTRQEANEWAERNIPAGSKVAVESFSILDQESLAFRATLQQRDIDLVWRATMHDLNYYRKSGYDYLAVSSYNYDRAYSQPAKYADRIQFYQQLDRELDLMAVFSPRADGAPMPFALDDLDTPFWTLFAYDRPGPTVKVYRLGS
ncbi:MAG TPA: glycosyltransferase family 39 protein [Chloroflexota bacterium]|nr:glycosyltransferase family 39 protein [Chloroflexota bacterium]